MQVENVGGRDGTFEADLLVDGEIVATETVFVEAGGTGTVGFEQQFDTPGEYELAVDDRPLGTLTVTAMTASSDAVRVVGASLPAEWVATGFEASVRATVVNEASLAANRTLTVTVDGQSVANETVSLGPNEQRNVTIPFEAVAGTVAVEGVEAGRIEVGEDVAQARTSTPDATTGAEVLFDPARIVVLVGAVFILGASLYVTGQYFRQ
ncbi:hypothetical protein [Halorarius litoreus]|uniref:hypothetical protein n=1 Tax=Halorarius litoreus TaxID=2962676 RepID=UPI0020CC78E1|nr:hypothetical protein [Halorarius litoreus]